MFEDLITNLAASVIYDFGKKILTIADKTEAVQLARRHLKATPTLHDFPDRYLESLVELRFEEKYPIVVDFFRNESIMQTFYDFYYGTPDNAGNEAKLDSEIQHFVQSLIEGDNIKAAGVDVKKEVMHFWLTFRQKVQESRTVKEVELHQKMEEIARGQKDSQAIVTELLLWAKQMNIEFMSKDKEVMPINPSTLQNEVQNASKMWNIKQIGTFNYYEANTSEEQNPNIIHIWIVSTTKNNYLRLKPERLKKHIPHEHYHDHDATQWIPFKEGESIASFVAEYKSKVSFEIQERFLDNQPLAEGERTWLFKNLKKVILVIDPLAMHETHIETISDFNTHEVGGCLALVCHCISYELFAYLRSQIEQNLSRLQTCFLDYSEKYIHFVFPISTKEMFFRSLTNIAMVHIKVSTKIQGADKNNEQKIRKQDFNFSI